MSKKTILKNYLKNKVDFNELQKEYNNSWLKNKPIEWLFSNGLLSKFFTYDLIIEGIKKAGYKHPDSDRTFITVENIKKELILEYIR